MARQALREFERSAQLFLVRDTLPVSGWVVYRAHAGKSVRERESAPDAEDGSCLKGLFVGLYLEVVAGLGLYGIWQLWRLVR
jgi:hypothetical protein